MKTRVALVFGGTNTEHEVSLVSAKAILNNIDQSKFQVIPIKITKENTWVIPKQIDANYQAILGTSLATSSESLATVSEIANKVEIDVVFPVLHGPYGEDGTIQGLLELMRLPYVGCGVASSAICMDKVLQKNICIAYGIPVPPFFWFTSDDWDNNKHKILQEINTKFDNQYPLFVKPANQGSSVGVTKAHNTNELQDGIKLALTRDLKVVVEQAIKNVREIECSVLGTNSNPKASVLGEILPGNEFYDYDAKYIDNNSKSVIPANLPASLSNKIRETALKAFRVLDGYGLARVDFLVNSQAQELYLNELNTLPGFTPISMYPKLWEASGLSYQDLLTKLIELALKRHEDKKSLNLSK